MLKALFGPVNPLTIAGPSVFPLGIMAAQAAAIKAPFTTESFLDAFTADLGAGVLVAPYATSWTGKIKAHPLFPGAKQGTTVELDPILENWSHLSQAGNPILIPHSGVMPGSKWCFVADLGAENPLSRTLALRNVESGRLLKFGFTSKGVNTIESGPNSQVRMGLNFNDSSAISGFYYTLRFAPQELGMVSELVPGLKLSDNLSVAQVKPGYVIQHTLSPIVGARILLSPPRGHVGPWQIPEPFKKTAEELSARTEKPAYPELVKGSLTDEVRQQLSPYALESSDSLKRFENVEEARSYLRLLVQGQTLTKESGGNYSDSNGLHAASLQVASVGYDRLIRLGFHTFKDTKVDSHGLPKERVEYKVDHFFDVWDGSFKALRVRKVEMELAPAMIGWSGISMFGGPTFQANNTSTETYLTVVK